MHYKKVGRTVGRWLLPDGLTAVLGILTELGTPNFPKLLVKWLLLL